MKIYLQNQLVLFLTPKKPKILIFKGVVRKERKKKQLLKRNCFNTAGKNELPTARCVRIDTAMSGRTRIVLKSS